MKNMKPWGPFLKEIRTKLEEESQKHFKTLLKITNKKLASSEKLLQKKIWETYSSLYRNLYYPYLRPIKTEYSIGLLFSSACTSNKKVQVAFAATLQNNNTKNVSYNVYNATYLPGYEKDVVKTMMKESFDLLYSDSALCTRLLKEATEEHHIQTPVVFSGVKNPVQLGIMESEEGSGNRLAGVTGVGHDYNRHVELFLTLKGPCERVLIPFDPRQNGGFLYEQSEMVAQILRDQGVREVVTVEVFGKENIKETLRQFIPAFNAVFILRDFTMREGIQDLIEMCNKHAVTICASDLDSVNAGAAMGYGDLEQKYGIESAKIAMKILRNKAVPETIPLFKLQLNCVMKINKKACALQGLHLSKRDISLVYDFSGV